MIKKPHMLSLSIKNSQEEVHNKSSGTSEQIVDQQKLQYAFEKPATSSKNSNSCRNSTGRLSAFDFLNVSSTKADEKKAFSITTNYFKNGKSNPIIKQPTNLYGFSKISSKIR